MCIEYDEYLKKCNEYMNKSKSPLTGRVIISLKEIEELKRHKIVEDYPAILTCLSEDNLKKARIDNKVFDPTLRVRIRQKINSFEYPIIVEKSNVKYADYLNVFSIFDLFNTSDLNFNCLNKILSFVN